MSRPEELLKSWLRLCTDPRTPADLLEKAAYWESINRPKEYTIRLAVAKHRAASSDVLAKLSMVKHLPLQIAVAAHTNLSEATSAKLMKMQVRELRRALAGNPKIPVYVMERLCRDYTDVRIRLAKNTGLPLKLMRLLADEKNPNIRMALAKNRKLHYSLLEKMGHDIDEEVRIAVVNHPDIPLAGLRHMANDGSERVRASVLHRATNDHASDLQVFRNLSKHSGATGEQARAQLDILERSESDASQQDLPEVESNPEES